MEVYELLYIIPFYVDPKESIEYYSNKIEEKGGQIIKSNIFTDNSLQVEEKLKDHCIFIKYSIDKQYNSYLIECLRSNIDIIRYIFIDTTNNKVDNKEQQEEDFAPKCPFCGGEFHLGLCDEEGNLRNNDYLDNPYSGISYCIIHSLKDVPNGIHCPIATSYDDSAISEYLYRTKEEALEALKLRSK